MPFAIRGRIEPASRRSVFEGFAAGDADGVPDKELNDAVMVKFVAHADQGIRSALSGERLTHFRVAFQRPSRDFMEVHHSSSRQ
jgi:hypothetical protein